MPRLRLAQPLWLDRPPRPPTPPALDRTMNVDVAIAVAASQVSQQRGCSPTPDCASGLLECARIGRGSTAASTALLMQEPDRDFAELVERYGPRSARDIWQMIRAATRRLIRTLRALEIRCALAECDSIYYATP